jgi:isoleucyl-tRNA synthetase
MATVLEDSAPFKTVLGYALVKDEKGEEMHKSKGNAIWFDEAAEEIGVDTLRWLYCRQEPEYNLNLGYKIANEVRRQNLLLFLNISRFFLTYANLSNWQPVTMQDAKKLPVLDRWILSRLESTKESVTQKLDDYHHHLAIAEIEKFLEDLSLWYIRRSRERLNPQNSDKQDQNYCFQTLYYVLKQLTLTLAPFIPFLTEEIWQYLSGFGENYSPKDSVHLQNWPKTQEKFIDHRLEKTMAQVREIISQGHSQRRLAEIKVRQPLKKFSIFNSQFSIGQELIELIKEELNVKEVEIIPGKGDLKVKLETRLTPKLIAEGNTRELIREIQVLRKEAGLSLGDKIKIQAPDWAKEFESEICRKTGAIGIEKADKLKIIKLDPQA